MTLLAIFLAVVFAHGIVSSRLERTVLTPPIVFTSAGMLASLLQGGLHEPPVSQVTFLRVAEVGLVLLLFTDAARTDLRMLRSIRALPARLLGPGMALTLLLGAAAGAIVFPELSLAELGILAAILAPTDAGLGQVIVTSPRVPASIREALNVEAGLNDGLSVPFLLFFVALANEGQGAHGDATLWRLVAEQLGLGVAVGLGVGLAGGWLVGHASRRGWVASAWEQMVVVALPIACVLGAEPIGASMFIAAFVAGLAVQRGFPDAARHSVAFAEEWGQLCNLAVFFLFGLVAPHAASAFGWRHLLYAAASLTVVRMLPVALALAGTGLSRQTVLFAGWFGPRGLASIVLGVVYLQEQVGHPGMGTIRLAVMATVLASIALHGLTAMPAIDRYARALARMPPDAPEHQGEAPA